MEKMLEEFSPSLRSQSSKSHRFAPAVDVYDEEGSVVIEAPLAGVNPEDVDITIENGTLTIEGESRNEHEVDDEDYYRKEVRSGSFFRQIALPTQVNEEEISAEFEDGVLTITCPKEKQEKGNKIQVDIK
jgi:HSP20 family protein